MVLERAVTGAKWTTVSSLTMVGLQMLQLMALAWILSRAEFGVASIVYVIVGFAQIFSDLGIKEAIIQRQSASDDELSSLFWLSISIGAALFVLMCLMAPYAATFYREPQLEGLTRLAALTLIITPIGQQAEALLQREFNFKSLAIVEIAQAAFTSTVAVALAFTGAGASAIVWGQLLGSTIKALGLLAIGRGKGALRLQLRYRDVRSYLAFGSYQIGERILNYATARIDVLIIGRFLGTDVLGAYTLAYQVVLIPLTRINPILTRVAFPVFARRQAAEEFLRKGFLALTKLLSIIVFPFLFGLALTSPLALPMIFGEKWSLSAALIPALSVVGVLKALSNPAGIVLLSKGRVAIGFWWNAFVLIANTTVFFIAVHWGLDAMIHSYVSLSIVYWLTFLLVLQRVLPFTWASYWSSLKPATVGCLAMAIALQAVYSLWPKLAAPVAEVAALIAAGGTAYVICLYILDAEYFRTLSRLVRVPKTES